MSNGDNPYGLPIYQNSNPPPIGDALRVGQELGRLEQRIVQLESDVKRMQDERDILFEHIDGLMEDVKANDKAVIVAHDKAHSLYSMMDAIVFALEKVIDTDTVEDQRKLAEGLRRVQTSFEENYKQLHIDAFGREDDKYPM